MVKVFRGIAFLILVGLLGCQNIFDDATWDVDALFPVAQSQLTLQDLVNEGDAQLESNADQSLSLVYQNTALSLEIDTLLDLPDTTLQETYPIPAIQLIPGVPYVNIINDTRYDINSVKMRYAQIHEGQIRIRFTNTVSGRLFFQYQLSSATKGTDTLGFAKVLEIGESVDETFDLADYELDFTGSDPIDDFNSLTSKTLAYLALGEDTVTGPFAPLELTTEFIGIVPDYVTGFFGSEVFELKENADAIDWFRNFPEGQIDLAAVRMRLGIRNGTGIEFQARFNEITLINSATDQRASLENDIIGSATPIFIDRAGHIPGTPQTIFYSEWETEFDETNANLDELLEVIPNFARYDVELAINPLGNTSQGNDFIYREAGIELFLEAEIPLEFSSQELCLIDTTEFDFGERDDNLDPVRQGYLKVYADNYYPLDTRIQLYIMDEQLQIIDSLVQADGLVNAAVIGTDGRVNQSTSSTLLFPIDQLKIDNLYAGRYLQIKALFTTRPDNELVKLYSDYRIDLDLVADITYGIE